MRSGSAPAAALALAAALIVATFALYWPVSGYPFVEFDDPGYVFENPTVRQGLSRETARWAFTSTEQANWHPLTWLSHLLDVKLYGLDAGAHHLTSVGIHALSGALLLLALRAMTGALWPSAAAAALFALHPLRVESVAWVAERKDVLSGLFFALALLAYARYARLPTWRRYAPVFAALALGLMAKPMLVTLPFVLLLLDWWPLGRIVRPGRAGPWTWRRLVLEKAPLLALSAASSVVTFLAQRQKAVVPLDVIPFADRLGTAIVAPLAYLGKALFPVGLAVFYPYRVDRPAWQPLAAALVLAAATALALAARRSRPYLAAGWLWHLGTLLPVIGLVQVGLQSMADRYTYLPLIGPAVAAAWAIAALARRGPRARLALAGIVAAVLAALAGATAGQLRHWRDDMALFGHAVEATRDNWLANYQVAREHLQADRLAEAERHYREALRIRPAYADALNGLAVVALRTGRPETAETALEAALALGPPPVYVLHNLGRARAALGRPDAAEAAFREALRLEPDDAGTLERLGRLLGEQGREAEAIELYRRSIASDPGSSTAHRNLGVLLLRAGRAAEALPALEAAERLAPGDPSVRKLAEQARSRLP